MNYQFITFNDYLSNLSYLNSLNGFKKFVLGIVDIPFFLSNQMQLLQELRMDIKKKDITYPVNFEIINKALFNIIK